MAKKIKQNKKKKVCAFACVAVFATMPFVLGNTSAADSTSPVTDLTNTKWVFDTDIIFPDLTFEGKLAFEFDFFTYGQSYSRLALYYDYNGQGGYQIEYDEGSSSLLVFDNALGNAEWVDNQYRTILITGGDDVTNQELIAFLQTNATVTENEEDSPQNLDIYDQIYQLLNQYLFDGQVTMDDMSYKNLMLTVGATVLSFFIVALPFMAIFAFIKMFF